MRTNKTHTKSETELTVGLLKKDPETHKRLKRTLFNQTKQDQMRFFKKILFFKATNNAKTNHLTVASWILAEGSGHVTFALK